MILGGHDRLERGDIVAVLGRDLGVRVALGACVVVLAAGAIVCFAWAPETKHARLAAGAATP